LNLSFNQLPDSKLKPSAKNQTDKQTVNNKATIFTALHKKTTVTATHGLIKNNDATIKHFIYP